jgi:hypothetical protein
LVGRLAVSDARGTAPPPAEQIALWQDIAGPGVDLEDEARAYLERNLGRPARDEAAAWIGWLKAGARRRTPPTNPPPRCGSAECRRVARRRRHRLTAPLPDLPPAPATRPNPPTGGIMTTPDLVTITCAGCGKTGQAPRGTIPADATFAMCTDCEADPERLAAAEARGERVGEGDVTEQPAEPVEPLDLVDVDGDRTRFQLNGGHTTEPVESTVRTRRPRPADTRRRPRRHRALTLAQLRQIVAWGLLILGDGFADPPAAPSTPSPWAALGTASEGDRG